MKKLFICQNKYPDTAGQVLFGAKVCFLDNGIVQQLLPRSGECDLPHFKHISLIGNAQRRPGILFNGNRRHAEGWFTLNISVHSNSLQQAVNSVHDAQILCD